jgi:preprotein translocase subunit SecE
VAAIVQEMFRFGLYKRNQGRIARQATFAAFAIIVALGALSLASYLGGYISDVGANNPDWPMWKQNLVHYGVPFVLAAAGLWASFRLVQMPTFADFLISVEGEMNKVSWPSRGELFRASLVVILVIFFLAGLLFLYDYGLTILLRGIDSLVESIFG